MNRQLFDFDQYAPWYAHKFQRSLDGEARKSDCFYEVNDLSIASAFGAPIPPTLSDLKDLAIAIYFVDRLGKGKSPRDLSVRIPLRQPKLWCSPEIRLTLCETLRWFTKDNWEFDFIQRNHPGTPSETQTYLFPYLPKLPVTVALFSGGLDSLAGACHQLRKQPESAFIFFSVGMPQNTGSIQRHLRKCLQSHFSRELVHVTVTFNRRKYGPDNPRDNSRLRSRGFVFLALGAVTALMAGANQLDIYENGIGAINLPYNKGQLGVDNPRAVHPLSLDRMGKLLSLLLNHAFTFHNPFLFSTKAEMCQAIHTEVLEDLISRSITCGHLHRVKDKPQCGICTSCLLRRQALYAVKMVKYDTRYHTDVLQLQGNEKKAYELSAMLEQNHTLQNSLKSPQPWQNLTTEYPVLWEIENTITSHSGQEPWLIQEAFVRMYRTYIDEWMNFPLPDSIRSAFLIKGTHDPEFTSLH